MSTNHYVALPDSSRVPLRGARAIGPADPRTPLTVTVYLRRDPDAPARPDVYELALQPPTRRTAAGDDEYAATHRWRDTDLKAVETFAAEHRLAVSNENPLARSVQLTGTTEDVGNAFRVTLARYRYQDAHARPRVYRGREGAVHVPDELDGIVTGVFGLDDRPIGADLLIRRADVTLPLAAEGVPALPAGVFFPHQLAKPYAYPADLDGSGQCIAVLAFNGESSPGLPSGGYSADALRTYFDALGRPMPDITDVVIPNVGSPGNDPGPGDATEDPLDSTGEIMLDLAVVGSLAPGAKIVVYFSKFTEQGWIDVINRIATDTVNRPAVISCSYGNPEEGGFRWTPSGVAHVDGVFVDAGTKNISICCASGDDGSRDDGFSERAHADFPASSPHVLGVGGTHLVVQGGEVSREVVWDDGPRARTGGGISRMFPVPPYQAGAAVPVAVNAPHVHGRGVPDVSAVASRNTGVVIPNVGGGGLDLVGGTSAAAPMWAALLARINQGLGAPVGFLNPLLYAHFAAGVLRDITEGSNGAYPSGTGWDPCTGLGSPGGRQLLDGLKAL
ncbi:S53 family peptidase [Streptomyces sp. NRRL S-350]|uniref:S53 family peptidase n=1 Tax=Streptomyces sp. NRRL S-350 TaxID=1463902 RepID=UPI0005637FBF|nr:S53 family peptidase [Streptomyces sp. NRRL S-350]